MRPVASIEKSPPKREDPVVSQLADARVDAAKIKLSQNRPDEALALLVSALKGAPASPEARDLARDILKETRWNLPALTLKHPLAVEQLAFAAPASLWVSLCGGSGNTTVRWNLEGPQIESVLFPTGDGETRSLIQDPASQALVVERQSVTLLCDAKSLKPIRELGHLPQDLTPSAVIVFSKDGLLMAHPESVSDRSWIWHVRDTATGEIIRSSKPAAADAPRPLAAAIDRDRLRVLAADGGLLEIPISPVAPILATAMPEPVKLLQAQFSRDGNSVLTLQDLGPHEAPAPSIISYGESDDGSLETDALIQRFPWSRHPNLWTSLMKNPQQPPFTMEGNFVNLLTGRHAPLFADSPVTAIAFGGDNVVIGEENGTVTVHRLLPLPAAIAAGPGAGTLDGAALVALQHLSHALAGIRYDEAQRTFTRISPRERVQCFEAVDFNVILPTFPQLDFSALITAFKATEIRTAGPETLLPLSARLARAIATGDPPPEVTAAFQSGDSPAIFAAIQSAGDKGPALATALALALESDHPDWIRACLAQAADLPPLLRRLAQSRVAWLEGRKADALAGWAEVFPDLAENRLREDWDGWEQADFQPALAQLRHCAEAEHTAIRIPENATPEQRAAVAARLIDPATLATVGKPRFAQACLATALALSEHKEEFQSTYQLANTARNLGAAPAPCLRIEALALTGLGDFKNARDRWVELITELPVAAHLPGDYAEAAYTSFENVDGHQAIEILNTGLRRFPEDANFALRAGWVALLTGNSERAYHFLRVGNRIGFPAEKLENATALLAIAAARTGAADDAAAYFGDLLALDPDWENPATADTLDWPEELKSTLKEFTQVEVLPDLLPELAPANP